MSSAYFTLQEQTQRAIQNGLGWRDLRPVQEHSIPAVLGGSNCLILAPTAGGKTEAAMFPVLDILVRDRVPAVGALYLSPLKALVNNQEERLANIFGLCGRTVFKWHGDVKASDKKAFLRDPADLLMTTPESLEVLLTASGPAQLPERKRLLGSIRSIVIDEIHAFAGDDRGDHLLALMDRLAAFIGRDIQRIGLSATVGNPPVLLEWLQGSSKRTAQIVDPGRQKGKRKIEVHPLSETESPSLLAARLAQGKKTLLFAESRSKTEELKNKLQELGVTTYVHHSAVAKELREQSEKAFQTGRNCCIVCTSTMELGLDVGDLDMVLQYHCPATVSAFLQRIGRTGRRAESPGHMAFLTDENWTFLQTLAILTLAMRGWVEPIRPSRNSMVVFLHQLLARVVGAGSVPVAELAGPPGTYCFAEMTMAVRLEILNHLIDTDYLCLADGSLMLGQVGEKKLSKNNFQDLYSIFDSPRALKVISTRGQEVGNLDAWFAQSLNDTGKNIFSLGGRSWMALRIDWENATILVDPAPGGKVATWMGSPRLLSYELCQEIRRVLADDVPLPFLSVRGTETLRKLREDWSLRLRGGARGGETQSPPSILAGKGALCAEFDGENCILYTFAGGRINNVIGKALQRETGQQCSINNFQLKVKGDPDRWDRTLEALRGKDYLALDVQHQLVQWLPKARFSKYQDLLPPQLLSSYLAARLLDIEGARTLAREPLRLLIKAVEQGDGPLDGTLAGMRRRG